MDHEYAGDKGLAYKAVILNAKGFGGNNATGLVLSPTQTIEMLSAKYGDDVIASYHQRNQAISDITTANDEAACHGDEKIRYYFGEAVMDENSVTMTQESLQLSEFEQAIELSAENPYLDYR